MLVVAGRVVVLNRNRVLHDGRQVGTVTTLRDRTELLAMQSELSARESVTETLRAQTHEFSNQLHTISGLIQLEEYDELSRVDRRAHPPPRRDQRGGHLPHRRPGGRRAADRQGQPGRGARDRPAAGRRRARCRGWTPSWPPTSAPCSATSSTTPWTPPSAAGGASVDVQLREDGDRSLVAGRRHRCRRARGHGGALPPRLLHQARATPAAAGVGLALVQVVCERRGGSVSVHNDRRRRLHRPAAP